MSKKGMEEAAMVQHEKRETNKGLTVFNDYCSHNYAGVNGINWQSALDP